MNKKDDTKVAETFSLTDVLTPVTVEETINSEKPKPKNVLWAKILVIIIIAMVSFLGLYKLVDYLNRPKTLFYSALDQVYTDFTNVASIIQGDPLYKALTTGGVEISTDSKIVASSLKDENAYLEEVVNTLDYTSKVKLDRVNHYVGIDVKGKKDSTDKLNISYVDDDYKRYIKFGELDANYLKFGLENINIDAFDAAKNVYLLDLIKNELINILEDEKFTSEETSIALNGKTVDCKKSTYTFTNAEVSLLIDRIISSIKTNSMVYYYVAEIYGLNASELDSKLVDFKNKLSIKSTIEYEFSAYTKASDDETARLELKYTKKERDISGEVVLAYNRDLDFMSLENIVNDNMNSITLNGKLEGDYNLIIKGSKNIYGFAHKRSDNRVDASLKVTNRENENVEADIKYNYDLKESSSNAYSLTSTVDITLYEDNKDKNFKITSNSIINGNSNIKKTPVDDYVELESYLKNNNTTFRNLFINTYKSISLEDPIIEPPVEIPIQ